MDDSLNFGSFEEKAKTLKKALCESIHDKYKGTELIFEILLCKNY